MKNGLEIQEFFVEGSNQKLSHVLLHIAEPITQQEKNKGHFFAIIEINGSYSEQISQLQQIIDDIEIKYYDEENNNIENYFESILQEINQQSHNVLQYKDSKINLLVGILQKRHLTIAYHGKPNAYLFYNTKDELKSTEIIDPNEPENHEQFFSSVIEGDMKDDDYLYISTPSVTSHFSVDRVRKIIQNKATKQGALHIQKVLDNLKEEYSFGGIIFQTPKPQLIEAKRYRNVQADAIGSQASMDDLVKNRKNTAETLSPSVIKNIKENLSSLFIKNKATNTNLANKKNERIATNHGQIETNVRSRRKENGQKFSEKILILIGRSIVIIASSIFFVIKKIIQIILSFFINSFYLITNKSGQRTIIMDRFHNVINEKKEKVKNVSLISKILFIALILLAIIFLSSIIYIKIKENKEAQNAQYLSLIDSINEKSDEVEAKILYGEEEKALEILEETKKLIENLPQDTEEAKTKFQELKNANDEILNKLQKMNSVTLELIADLNNSKPSNDLEKIAKLDTNIFAYSEKDKNMYKVNLISKEIEIKNHDNQKDIIHDDTPKENDKIIFLGLGNKLFEYNKDTQSYSTKDIVYPADNANANALTVYNRKLYIVSAKNEQIYKHNQTQTGYDKGTVWITKKSSSLSKAIDIAVDGNVFVLTSDAKILRFYGGEEENFNIEGVHPVLTNPTKIWTYADSDYLYILEPEQKRIVRLDKDGKFIEQFTSYEWKKPSDMIIDEDNKVIYVLDENKIYKFSTK
ncbi:MAG: hypothetical protein WC070_00230 [Candidatus Magasanikbacteria bacterium]